jgi:hypothetical protein
MELDVHEPIKQALARAKSFYESKDYSKAASAYEKASNLMSIYAEQAIGREAEERRKKKAIEYREMARKLRAGEVTPGTPAPSSATSAGPAAAPAAAVGEIRSIVSNLMHASKITWDDIGGLDETKNEIKFALGMTLAQQPPGVKIAAWT